VVKRRLIAAAVLLGIGAVLWFPVLSGIMYGALRLKKVLPSADPWMVPLSAFFFWRDYADLPAVTKLWKPCMLFATAVACAPAGLLLLIPMRERIIAARPGQKPPPPVRANSDLHGHADWMSEADLRRLANEPLPSRGGVVLGTTCRADLHPDQDGGNAPLVRDPCTQDATHGLGFCGSGGGKTSAGVTPTLDPEVGWRGNVLVNDPSSQAGSMCGPMREEWGQRVVCIGMPRLPNPNRNPDLPPEPPRVGINLFGWIDPADPLFEEHVRSTVESLGPEKSVKPDNDGNRVFKVKADDLQVCLLADLMSDPNIPASQKTPARFIELAYIPEHNMKGVLETIYQESHSRLARLLAGALMRVYPKTFSGFCAETTADLSWLTTQSYANLVSGTAPGSILPADFTHSDLCVFLQLGVKTMEDTPEIGRAILTALLNDIYRAEGQTRRSYLLELDEIDRFGKLDALSTAASQGRKYRIVVNGWWHNIGQMEKRWGEAGASTWRANAAWEFYSAMDEDTAKAVSERCGTYTAIAPSEGRSSTSQSSQGNGGRSRGTNEGTTLQAVKLLTAYQAERDLRPDEAIIFKRGARQPIRLVKAYYFRRPDMAAKVIPDQYQIAAE